MANIQYIKNVTVAVNFNNSSGTFSMPLNNMPSIAPDEVIIRAITWFSIVGADPNNPVNNQLYLLWSSINQDFIGSFCGQNLTTRNMNTTIRLNGAIPNMIEFKIYTPISGGVGVQYVPTIQTGDIAIHMDFIKYRNVPLHA